MRPRSQRVLVWPTTPRTVRLAKRLFRRGNDLCVVGSRYFPGLSPSQLISSPRLPAIVVSFSDQLTSPLDAIVAARDLNGWKFVSPIEFFLSARHGYEVRIWSPRATRLLGFSPTQEQVAQGLVRYLRDCDSLGDGWVPRAIQVERTPDWRAKAARAGVRQLKSSILQELSMGPETSPKLAESFKALCDHEKDISTWHHQYDT